MNKKGAEMAVGTIVIIVLAVLVLVFLIWGFSAGWGNLWSKITSYIGGGSNVADIKQACMLACEGGQANEYCLNVRSVKLPDGKVIKGACKNFQGTDYVPGLTCGSINCPIDGAYKQTCADLGGNWYYPTTAKQTADCGNKVLVANVEGTDDRAKFVDGKDGKPLAIGADGNPVLAPGQVSITVTSTNSVCCK